MEQKQVIENLKASMLPVRGGVFYMGDTHSLYNPLLGSKIGSTKVELSDFHICDHTLTNVEWCAITGEPLNGNPNEPKTNVTWHDVYDFLSKLNKQTGWNFRLPTEAEWEYAARGGELTHDTVFAGGTILDNVGWYKINSKGRLQDVCQLKCNELGLYDMSGNVREWCSDIYAAQYAVGERTGFFSSDRKPVNNPQGALSGRKRVVRGGSYLQKEIYSWVFFRDKLDSTDSAKDCGFRLAY